MQPYPFRFLNLATACLAAAGIVLAQANWLGFGSDPAHTRFSTLNQITPANVGKLRVAWTYDLGTKGRKWEATPLVAGDLMYFTLPQGQDGVIAVDPTSGKQLWKYESKGSRGRSNRAVSYWPGDSRTPARLLLGDVSRLRAATCLPLPPPYWLLLRYRVTSRS